MNRKSDRKFDIKARIQTYSELKRSLIEQYTIHAGRSIPNIWTIGSHLTCVSNQAYAIEPFVTTKEGEGVVYEGAIRNIFSITSRKPTKDKEVDDIS